MKANQDSVAQCTSATAKILIPGTSQLLEVTHLACAHVGILATGRRAATCPEGSYGVGAAGAAGAVAPYVRCCCSWPVEGGQGVDMTGP